MLAALTAVLLLLALPYPFGIDEFVESFSLKMSLRPTTEFSAAVTSRSIILMTKSLLGGGWPEALVSPTCYLFNALFKLFAASNFLTGAWVTVLFKFTFGAFKHVSNPSAIVA